MDKAILIIEICEEGTNSHLCYYDKLPSNVKRAVDGSLGNKSGVSIDIYQDGLQFLYDYNDKNNLGVFVENNTDVKYIGSATIYHIDD